MSRITEVKEIYAEITKEITKDKEAWKDFLKFSSNIYKYDFNNAVLIYAQKPDATMVANMKIWNRNVGRYVNKGTRSIAVFDSNSIKPKLQYLFDIKDTNGPTDRIPKLWELDENVKQPLLNNLNKKYNLKNTDINNTITNIVEFKINEKLKNIMNNYKNNPALILLTKKSGSLYIH